MKGIVRPKLTFHPIDTHHFVESGCGGISPFTLMFWSFMNKNNSTKTSELLLIWGHPNEQCFLFDLI